MQYFLQPTCKGKIGSIFRSILIESGTFLWLEIQEELYREWKQRHIPEASYKEIAQACGDNIKKAEMQNDF